ncbi:hypothetical protein DY000_02004472 [Brassica cretica]|uniref:Uncharacterized protein n=1 Tax=Brassica cretica TaxID=69181 RepID=A0ABQ7CEP1_BRACR|nr:hypothetical protein DY000_02004472 [Brassica cretica]
MGASCGDCIGEARLRRGELVSRPVVTRPGGGGVAGIRAVNWVSPYPFVHLLPFGDRAATYQSRASPLRKKITPNVDTEVPRNMRTERSPPRRNEITEVSPQYSRRRVVSNRGHFNQDTRSHVEQQWRAKAQHTERNEGKERAADEHRLPLERNLDKEDLPPLQFAQVPPTRTTEEVMEELREVTYQYTNCADPVESAARKQRVLDGEVHGLMEQTAATIVAREQEAQQAYITTRVAETEVENEMETEQSATLPLVLP